MTDVERRRLPRFEPLWDRVDRNRLRLIIGATSFVVLSVASFDALFTVAVTTLMLAGGLRVFGYEAIESGAGPLVLTMQVLSGGVAVAAAGWAAWSIANAQRLITRRLGAVVVPKGDLLDTKYALKDMAIASGLTVAPELFVIDDDNCNAAAIAVGRHRPAVLVTWGFVEKFPIDEQRAVFANLVARVVSGDTMLATGISALLAPLHALTRGVPAIVDGMMIPERTARSSQDSGSGSAFVAWAFFFGIAFAILSAVITRNGRITHLKIAEKADAEGMLLLKDPGPMVRALERGIRTDNHVALGGDDLATLFYMWGSVSSNDEDDPQCERLDRLREVLGIEGIDLSPTEEQLVERVRERALAPPPPRIEGGGAPAFVPEKR